jgi:hypothetical protein
MSIKIKFICTCGEEVDEIKAILPLAPHIPTITSNKLTPELVKTSVGEEVTEKDYH